MSGDVVRVYGIGRRRGVRVRVVDERGVFLNDVGGKCEGRGVDDC